ncbi:hypothetical protein [Streptomyces sp. NPDC050428]|uniref:hypothetical protein n=1 Tax=Streptomyces sp. NPDC050428 TaxID=3155757 RepID=UPI003415E2BF
MSKKSKHKLIVLIALAVLAMSALFYVNLQHVRDTGPRGAVSSGGISGWSLSGAS